MLSKSRLVKTGNSKFSYLFGQLVAGLQNCVLSKNVKQAFDYSPAPIDFVDTLGGKILRNMGSLRDLPSRMGFSSAIKAQLENRLASSKDIQNAYTRAYRLPRYIAGGTALAGIPLAAYTLMRLLSTGKDSASDTKSENLQSSYSDSKPEKDQDSRFAVFDKYKKMLQDREQQSYASYLAALRSCYEKEC